MLLPHQHRACQGPDRLIPSGVRAFVALPCATREAYKRYATLFKSGDGINEFDFALSLIEAAVVLQAVNLTVPKTGRILGRLPPARGMRRAIAAWRA